MKEQAVKMKEMLKVLNAMRSDEMENPLNIKGTQKERIAISAGVVRFVSSSFAQQSYNLFE